MNIGAASAFEGQVIQLLLSKASSQSYSRELMQQIQQSGNNNICAEIGGQKKTAEIGPDAYFSLNQWSVIHRDTRKPLKNGAKLFHLSQKLRIFNLLHTQEDCRLVSVARLQRVIFPVVFLPCRSDWRLARS